jgi:hypothetical protein
VAEFQGGSGTGWGTVNQEGCNALVNQESVRVLWKNNYSFGIKIFNIYMVRDKSLSRLGLCERLN